MKNHKFLFWIGILVIVMPFLGIPQSWKHLISFLIGIVLVSIALVVRHNLKLEEMEGHDEPVFEESEEPAPVVFDEVVVPDDDDDEDEDDEDEDDDEDDEDEEEEK